MKSYWTIKSTYKKYLSCTGALFGGESTPESAESSSNGPGLKWRGRQVSISGTVGFRVSGQWGYGLRPWNPQQIWGTAIWKALWPVGFRFRRRIVGHQRPWPGFLKLGL